MRDQDVSDECEWSRISEMFRDAPTETCIPLSDKMNHSVIIDNLHAGAILESVAVDAAGRLWWHDRKKSALVMFFDPNKTAQI